MLRSHTTAHVPPLLRAVASAGAHDVLLACPGIVYRRDAIDRRHAGEPHQLELWRVRRDGPALTEDDLEVMITTAVLAVLPDREWRTTPATHPYTLAGRQLDVRDGDDWLEVGECGLAHPEVLAAAGLPSTASGLAMGLGLDRLVMLRKGIDDIRLLRADDPRVAVQLGDLRPYRPVSNRPPVVRDLSLAVDGDADAELLGDQVRAALGADADAVEEVTVVDETPLGELPPAAIARLGIGPGQKNVLLRIVLRHPARTLRKEEANAVRDRVAAALHRGVPTAYRDDPGVATAPWQTPTPERTTTAGSTSSSPTTTPSSSRA